MVTSLSSVCDDEFTIIYIEFLACVYALHDIFHLHVCSFMCKICSYFLILMLLIQSSDLL